jgi:hypothetical protein
MQRLRLLLFVLAVLARAAPALAQQNVALVIGNSAYRHSAELTNPRNDATDLSAALKRLGFQVIEGVDLDKRAMERLIQDFAAKLSGAKLALFFYAGHGMQVEGQNYLLPIDARLSSVAALDFEGIPLSLVLRQMERETKTNLVLLDACRDNPLSQNLARSMGTRSSSRVGGGLAEVKTGVGTLIGFSTEPGSVALDGGGGRNSPYTQALLDHIESPGKEISATLASVRRDVVAATNGQQVPWEHTSLMGPVVLKPDRRPPAVARSPRVSPGEAAQICERSAAIASEPVLRAMADQYQGTTAAACIKARLEELRTVAAASEQRTFAPKIESARPPDARPPDSGVRNPFGVEDVLDPYGPDVRRLAAAVRLAGGSDDKNAEQWAPGTVDEGAGGLGGAWFSRWAAGTFGVAMIRVVGDRFFALYTNASGPLSGKTWILEAVLESNNRLVGRWVQVGNPRDTGPFVGLVVNNERIDAIWNWAATERWDFRRKFKR